MQSYTAVVILLNCHIFFILLAHKLCFVFNAQIDVIIEFGIFHPKMLPDFSLYMKKERKKTIKLRLTMSDYHHFRASILLALSTCFLFILEIFPCIWCCLNREKTEKRATEFYSVGILFIGISSTMCCVCIGSSTSRLHKIHVLSCQHFSSKSHHIICKRPK